ncbi:MAG: fibronectin type III domain-containing protein, partial [Acutalibacteraceae bacterium]
LDKTVDISTLEPYTEKTILDDYYIYTLTGTEFVYKGLSEEAHIHTYNSGVVTKAATCTATGVKTYTCTVCGATKTESIAKTAHTYKTTTTKATTAKNGSIVTKCSACGYIKSQSTIYYPKSITLSSTKYTYDGKVKTPTVTVKDSKGNTLKKGTDYTVTYASGRKSTGKYSVTIKFIGNYSGTKTLYFYILPGKTTSLTATQTTSSIKATWKAVTGASGYKVVLYSSKGKALKTIYTTKTSYSFSKLTKGTSYKVRVTAYKTINGTKVYSTGYTTLTTATKPGTPTLKVTAGTKKATLSWNKQTGATGYVIYMATSKNGTYKKIATVRGATKVSYTKTGLIKGKTYYFKVAAYETVDGKNIYGTSSSVKYAKIK